MQGLDTDKDQLAHFVGYGESSLQLRLLCYAASSDIQDAWALRQRVLLVIGEVVEQAGGSMPFPTRLLIRAPDAMDHP